MSLLQGVAPGDIPIERSQRLLLTLNLKTAAALGLSLSSALAVSAHRVIR
jgi:putative ABC transport system substrate-binding protein